MRGRRVIHNVELSLFHNWVGTRQVRDVTVDDDAGTQITLVSPPIELDGNVRTQRLTWRRRGT